MTVWRRTNITMYLTTFVILICISLPSTEGSKIFEVPEDTADQNVKPVPDLLKDRKDNTITWNAIVTDEKMRDKHFKDFAELTSTLAQLKSQLENVIKSVSNLKEGCSVLHNSARPAATSGKSCASLYNSGERKDGVYKINPDGLGYFPVRCDMTTDGGGWTVFQRRLDASEDFYRGWQDYKNGFGDLNGEFWLGLDKIHRLTQSGQNVLRVDLMDFDYKTAYAKFGTFSVAGESESYRLDVSSYSGTAGDSLTYHNGMKFTTKDRQNDNDRRSCALQWKGGWWYNRCHVANLNGLYLRGYLTTAMGINWYYWKNAHISLKRAEMKIRPAQF